MFEIEVERIFHASHALQLPDGSLEPVHAHHWRVVAIAAAEKLDAMSCVMDFHRLEKLLDDVIDPWRDQHLNDVPPFVNAINPSAERVAEQLALAIAEHLPRRVHLKRVSVTEATGCRATYLPDDSPETA